MVNIPLAEFSGGGHRGAGNPRTVVKITQIVDSLAIYFPTGFKLTSSTPVSTNTAPATWTSVKVSSRPT